MKATKPWNNQRFIGIFDVVNTTKQDSGRYRCVVHSTKGVGVSNYGELTIKRESASYTLFSPFLPHTPVPKKSMKQHTHFTENFLPQIRVSPDQAVKKNDAHFI